MRNQKLALKQEAFAMGYMETGNACEAYRRAYNADRMKRNSIEVTASQLLQHPKVALRVTELREEAAKRDELSIDWVLQHLKEIVSRAMQAVPVLDKQGEPTGEYTYQGAVANRALELIGKHVGMFSDRDPRGDKPVQIT
jgi:phage terminase small subunit